MEWNKIFITGIEEIDKQHKTLFDIIEKLKKSTKDSEADKKEDIHKILLSLVKYAKVHFSYEEAYLESINYKDILNHKKIHHSFLLELKNIIQEYKENGSYHDVKLYIFLVKWLQKHIAIEDQKYTKES